MISLALPPIARDLQIPLILLTNILSLALHRSHRFLAVGLSFPLLVLLVSQSLYREWEKGWGLHYGVNCFIMTVAFAWVEWVALGVPDREGWRKVVRGEKMKKMGEEEEKREKGRWERDGLGERIGAAKQKSDGLVKSTGSAAPQPTQAMAPTGFGNRLWWAVRLATTNRYVGWSCEAKNVPLEVGPAYPRLKFLARKIPRAALFYVLRDVVNAYTAASPHGTWLDLAHVDPVVSFEQEPFLYRFKFTWVYVVLTYVSLELMATLYGIVSVVTGLARPVDCPGMFGDLRECYNVRRAWSVVWHQQVRHVCSAPGIWLVRDVLKLRRGSFGSKYVQLFVAFGVSAAIHGGASMLCHASLNEDGAFKSFLLQAVIILLEDHVIALGKRYGLKDSAFWRVVGLCWTVLAIGWSMEGWTGKTLRHGLWVHDREVDIFGIGPK